jgi:hypothetical protein
MKRKLLFSLTAFFLGGAALAQPVCKVVSPSSIAGNKQFTWATTANSWNALDLSVAGNFVEDTVMFVEDGTPGLNPQGNPISQEGCNPLTNNLSGKIALIYRNTCGFGLKAELAQAAGAVGVIIINRETALINMLGGAEGLNVTIPVAFIQDVDGAAIKAEMANGPVVMFLGNKLGVYANDLTLKNTQIMRPKSGAVVADLAQNGTEFNFEVGGRLYNSGSADIPAGFTVNAKVTDPSNAVVYDETVTGTAPLVSMDSIDIFPTGSLSFPQFSLSSYPLGTYTLTYTVMAGATLPDDDPADNVWSTNFVVSDSLFTYASVNPTTQLPNVPNGFRPSTTGASYSGCLFIKDPNGSRIGVEGVYWSVSSSAADSIDLTNEEITITVQKWDDPFVDLTDASITFNSLAPVAIEQYTYPSDLQSTVVYQAFSQPVMLTDNEKYLVCAQTTNPLLFIGSDPNSDYTFNINTYLQPVSPIEVGGVYNALGFGGDAIQSIGAKVFPASELAVEKTNTLIANAYPNPLNDKLNIRLNAEGKVNILVTDLAGKVVSNTNATLVGGATVLNTSNFESGMYIVNISTENGTSTKVNVVKR